MNCVIVDDNLDVINTIKLIFNSHIPNCKIIGEAHTILEGKECIDQLKPDLVFLDIQLPDGKGFEILKTVKHKNFFVVVMTMFGEYAKDVINDSFIKTRTEQFLYKPFKTYELLAVVSKINFKKNNLKKAISNHIEDTIKLATAKEIYFPKFKDIIYVRANGAYAFFWIPSINNTHELHIQGTLGDYCTVFPKKDFCRISQSDLINLHTVTRIDRRNMTVELKGTNRKPKITAKYKNELLKALECL